MFKSDAGQATRWSSVRECKALTLPAALLQLFLWDTGSHLQKVVIVLMRRDGSVQLLLPVGVMGAVRLGVPGRSPRMPCS